MSLVSFESWELILQFVSSGLTKLDETIGYCWCPIVMRWSLWLQQRLLWLHHCDVIHWDNKAVSQWLLTFNLCVSVTWPLTCAFHIPCTHTPEIIDMHRGVCDKRLICHRTYRFQATNRHNIHFTKFDMFSSETYGLCNEVSLKRNPLFPKSPRQTPHR